MTEPHSDKTAALQVGWGAADITPEETVILCGQFAARVSTHVQDPLTVTALALESVPDDGRAEQAVMVSCDLVAVTDEILAACRVQLRERLPDFDAAKLFLNATHTHTGPEIRMSRWPDLGVKVMADGVYMDFVVSNVVAAVEQAWKSRRPGGICWGFGEAVIGHNRRMTYLDGAAKMYGKTDDPQFSHIEGYEDHSVDMLFAWDDADRLTGMVLNLACPSQVTESASYVSADFWHEARCEIRRRHGDGLFILPQCSAAGDQSPHLLLHKQSEARMRDLKGVSERQEIALRLADAVDAVLPVARKDVRRQLPFAHTVETIELTRRVVTEDEMREAKAGAEKLQQEYDQLIQSGCEDYRQFSRAYHRARWYERGVERYELQKTQPTYPVELHVIRLGDVALATNTFELFLDFGLRIKARSKAVQTFLVQLAGPGGYVPTERAVAAKSYGAGAPSNIVGPEGGQELVEATVERINALWASWSGCVRPDPGGTGLDRSRQHVGDSRTRDLCDAGAAGNDLIR